MSLFKLVVNASATCSSVERLCIFSKRKCMYPYMYMHVCMCIYCAFIHASVLSASARESAIDFSGACVYIVHLYMHWR